MSPRGWTTAFRDALFSMTRNGVMTLASMLSVAVSLLVLAVVLLLAVNLEYMAATAEQQVEVTAYLCTARREEAKCNQQDLTPAQTEAIVKQIRQMPNVKEARFVSRHEALEELKRTDPSQRELLAGYEGEQNPLSDEVHIQVVEVEQVGAVADAVLRLSGVAKVVYGQEWVPRLLAFTNAIRIGGAGLVLLLAFATVLTLSNTIRLSVYARRREISIMKLVGATNWYIRRPFMIEGVFMGLIGAAIATASTGYGYVKLIPRIQQSVPFLPVIQPGEILMDVTLGLLVLGAALGGIGSLLSLRRFLKV